MSKGSQKKLEKEVKAGFPNQHREGATIFCAVKIVFVTMSENYISSLFTLQKSSKVASMAKMQNYNMFQVLWDCLKSALVNLFLVYMQFTLWRLSAMYNHAQNTRNCSPLLPLLF